MRNILAGCRERGKKRECVQTASLWVMINKEEVGFVIITVSYRGVALLLPCFEALKLEFKDWK